MDVAGAATADNSHLQCEWGTCTAKFAAPEELYTHLCEDHVGRKAKNNRSLRCAYPGCTKVCEKRDHLTSHLRIHVPFKPFPCRICNKSFKRNQDLRKHAKTHASDYSDVPAAHSTVPAVPHPNLGVYPPGTNLAHATTPHCLSDLHLQQGLRGQDYGVHPPASNVAYPMGNQRNYENGYYTNSFNGANAHLDPLAGRKRASAEALDQFFGAAKRQHMDMREINDLGHRLLTMEDIELPMSTAASVYRNPASVPTSGYVPQASAPAPAPPTYENLKSREDIFAVNDFLAQLESQLYEQSDSLLATRDAQAQYFSTADNACEQAFANPAMCVAPAQSCYSATPALTPASSTLSHSAGNSPVSIGSANGVSPPQPSSVGLNYPRLPTTSMSGHSNVTYPASTLRAPVSNLGTLYDLNSPRRYSSGVLQRAADPESVADLDDLSKHTHHEHVSKEIANEDEIKKEVDEAKHKRSATPPIDPALQSATAEEADSATPSPAADVVDPIHSQMLIIDKKIDQIRQLRKFLACQLGNPTPATFVYDDDCRTDDGEEEYLAMEKARAAIEEAEQELKSAARHYKRGKTEGKAHEVDNEVEHGETVEYPGLPVEQAV